MPEGHIHHHGHATHDHAHHHGVVSNIRLAFIINLTFAGIELVGGLLTNSVAILSDALHDLGDSISLAIAWYLEKVAGRKADQKYTYGYARFSVLSAVLNSMVLLAGSAILLTEAIPRLIEPVQPDAKGMIWLSILGLAANGLAAWRLMKGNTINERAVALHMLEDLAGWAAVFIGSLVMLFWEVPLLDPILSVMITLYIVYGVIKNLQKTVSIFLQAIPEKVSPQRLSIEIEGMEGVRDVHDVHVWSLDGQFHIATMHVVVDETASMKSQEQLKNRIRQALLKHSIQHATIEIESTEAECATIHPSHATHPHDHDHDHDHDHHHGHHHK